MFRITKQRQVLLEELKKFQGHPTADELYDKVKKKLSRISLATVYRNLEILSEEGVISKIEISGRQKRFDSEIHQHDHVYCLHCNRVDNINLPRNPDLAVLPEDVNGYVLDGYRVEFMGLCPACLKKKHSNKNKGERTMGCKKCGTNDLSDAQRQVLEALAQSKDPCGSKDIAAAAGMESKKVSCQVTALKKKGFVDSPARCKYEITKEGKKALA